MDVSEFVSEPVEHDFHGQGADPGPGLGMAATGEFLGEDDPHLPKQVRHAFEQEPVDRITAGRFGLGLILLPIGRFDAEALPVQAALPHGLPVDVPSPGAAPTIKGKGHRFRAALPE